MLAADILNHARYIAAGEWSVQYTLPLHLCDISLYLCIIMLLSNSFRVYETAYFWGLGGVTQALLTPDLGYYSFPHFVFYQFFIAHGAIVVSCLFMTVVNKFRPALKSIWKTILITNAYAAVIAVFNQFTGANYLFICRKPAAGSLMDHLGPWPWYLISLEFVALALFFVLYLPFIIIDIPADKKSTGRGISG